MHTKPDTALGGQKIVLTGARGFIGGQVLRDLIGQGASVRVLLRTGHEAARLRALGADVVVAPLKPGPVLDQALNGQHVVVHIAYDVRAGFDENIASFDALLGATQKAGVNRFVQASSVVVYDNWPDGKIDENAPVTNGGGPYRQAKIAMENNLLESEMNVTILQPTLVYGPGSALWTDAPVAALAAGGVVLPDPVGCCAAVHIKDVSQAFVKAVENQMAGQRRFLISGPECPDWHRFYQGYRDILGRGTITMRPVAEIGGANSANADEQISSGPSMAARLSAKARLLIGNRRFDRIVARLRRFRPAHAPTHYDAHMIALLTARPEISIERARAELDYEPVFDFDRGLADIRDHLR